MKKYNEETKPIGFRIPISEISNVRELVYNYLNGTLSHQREDITYGCGCALNNNLFHRNKGCGLTKTQHDERR